MSHPSKHPPLAWILLFLLALIWGSSFILMKRGLIVFSAGEVGALRIVIAFLLLLPIALKHWRAIPAHSWRYVFLTGCLGNLLPAFLFATAQQHLASSVVGILNALTPIFTLLVGVLFFALPLRKWQLIGIAMGFAGSISLSWVQSGGEVGSFNPYILLIVMATVCYGISVNIIGKYLRHLPSLAVSSTALTTVGPLALIYLGAVEHIPDKLAQGSKAWLALGYVSMLGIFGTALGLIFFNKLVKITSPVFGSSVTYLIPLVALLWGIVDSEAFGLLHLTGMMLIVGGVYVANRT
ncbi:MAG: DMT family transporter [Cytophagales bacterium]|nr:DMT family transporter [Bernardetiaceae bacterium]MDW8205255.1 DMT family transporter [Cytophagales bacterium]